MTSASAPPPWRQIMAGRALLAWSQADLASAANLGASVVHELEVNGRETNPGVFDTLRAALEVAGISFGEREPEFSQSRSVEPRSDRGQPLRWIQATDLEQWADTRAGQQDLPELLSRLLRAENGASARLRFPSGDSVTHAGWDGLSYVERQQPYTPAGWTGWELGAQRAKITAKANIDYQHRADDPLGRVREETSFVFVTPRRWRDKDKWLAARRTEGQWRDVVAYDAEDLVHWIELYPAVAYWLADRIDKRPAGVRALADVWDQWSGATRRPLTEELTRLGRDEEAMRVLRWLSGPADTLLVQAETTEEALAFLFSCIEMLPETDRDAVLSRALVPSDAPSALTLSEAATPLILGLRDGDVGFARTLSRKGHHVYLTVEVEVDRGEVLRLPPVPRWALSDGLRNMGFDHFEASNLARDAGRSLTILRRLLPPAAGRRPTWPGAAEARPTMAALLLGGWYEDSTADLEAVETLAGVPYEAFSREAARLLVERGGPLLKIDRVWKLASPLDAWFSGAEGLTEADIGRFLALAREVLSVRDPAFDMPLSERWLAPIQPRGPHYSGLLRRAVADTLILLELYGGRARLAPKASKRTRDLLTDLLRDADDALWWSLADVLRQLAEASPAAFLAAVDRALMAHPSPLLSLFECDERTHSTAHVGQLLWSLERLAWDPALLGSVADILARLDALDPGGRNMARPAASLRRIFLSWTPQTNASLEQRLTILDLLRAQHPQTAWRLLIAILPQPHSMSMPSDYPRWRDCGADEREILTHDLVEACVDAVAERMCADVGADVARWKDVLEALGNVPEAARRKLGGALLQRTAAIDDPAERDELRTDLRKMLGKHREFQDADWAIPMDHLADFARAYDQLEPADPVWRYGWLFRNGTDAHRYRGDWSAMMAEDERRRASALEEIVSQLGKTGVLRLLDQGARPEWVAAALMQAPSAEPLRMEMIREGLSAEDGPGWQMARSCIFAALETAGRTWIDPLLATALANSDDERAAVRLLLVLKGEPCVWRLAEEAGSLVEAAYWRGVSPWALSDERAHLIFAVEKLKAFGRPRVAAHLIAAKLDRQLPVDLIVGVLRAAVGDPDRAFGAHNEPEMWTYNLEQVLQHLGARDDADEATMIELEWRYYGVLQHTAHQAPRLQAALANDPAFFLMILKLVYAPAEESGIVEPELENSEQMAAIVKQGWRLLDDWNRVPGATDHGEIDPAALNAWVETVRSGAEAVGRLAVAEIRLGKVLARAPKTSDGAWPPPPVCALLETLEGEELGDAFILGVINKRGVTVRMPNDGGALERAEAAHYRAAGAAIRARYPKTAALLERVAKSYDDHAQREDVQAEQRDIL